MGQVYQMVAHGGLPRRVHKNGKLLFEGANKQQDMAQLVGQKNGRGGESILQYNASQNVASMM